MELQDENKTNKLFISEYDLRNVFKFDPKPHHLFFESVCFNDFFFENKIKYEYKAVFDQDEAILPRNIKLKY